MDKWEKQMIMTDILMGVYMLVVPFHIVRGNYGIASAMIVLCGWYIDVRVFKPKRYQKKIDKYFAEMDKTIKVINEMDEKLQKKIEESNNGNLS